MTEPWNAAEHPVPVPGRSVTAAVVLALIGAYKVLLSPLFTGSCRFQPSCSDYMAEAVRSHGAVRGTSLGLRRLAKCHPFGRFGFDPVPPARNDRPHPGVAEPAVGARASLVNTARPDR